MSENSPMPTEPASEPAELLFQDYVGPLLDAKRDMQAIVERVAASSDRPTADTVTVLAEHALRALQTYDRLLLQAASLFQTVSCSPTADLSRVYWAAQHACGSFKSAVTEHEKRRTGRILGTAVVRLLDVLRQINADVVDALTVRPTVEIQAPPAAAEAAAPMSAIPFGLCKDCFYWRKPGAHGLERPLKPGGEMGECRQRSPRHVGAASFAYWPRTEGDHGCGDFQPRQPNAEPKPSAAGT